MINAPSRPSTKASAAATTVPPLQHRQNPAPFFKLRRALLITLEGWVLNGVEPPPSRYPTLAEGTLVPFDAKSVVLASATTACLAQ